MTPDDLMGRPIWDVIRFVGDAASRVVQGIVLEAETGPEPVRLAYLRDLETMLSGRVVLRLRADEVVGFCERAGIGGCTSRLVQEEPLWVASVVYRYLVEDPHDAG